MLGLPQRISRPTQPDSYSFSVCLLPCLAWERTSSPWAPTSRLFDQELSLASIMSHQ
jgi:hypothetical protein